MELPKGYEIPSELDVVTDTPVSKHRRCSSLDSPTGPVPEATDFLGSEVRTRSALLFLIRGFDSDARNVTTSPDDCVCLLSDVFWFWGSASWE